MSTEGVDTFRLSNHVSVEVEQHGACVTRASTRAAAHAPGGDVRRPRTGANIVVE